jgi:hypothetical protein
VNLNTPERPGPFITGRPNLSRLGAGAPVAALSAVAFTFGTEIVMSEASDDQQQLIALLPADQLTADKLRQLR